MVLSNSEFLVFVLVALNYECKCEDGKNGIPKQCLNSYSDCVREPLFKSCNRTILTPAANITILPTTTSTTAQLRCLDYNHHNVIITPLFSWIKWNPGNLDNKSLDLDTGSFTHVNDDQRKHFIKSIVYRQDTHAQTLTIVELNASDYGLYTCVICTKYGRSYQSILLKPGPKVVTVIPSFKQPTLPPANTPFNTKNIIRTESRTNHTSTIAFFVVGALLVIAIIIALGFLIRHRVLKSSSQQGPTSPRPLFPSDSIPNSPTMSSAGDTRWQRNCSTSTFSSSLRSSSSSSAPVPKQRRSSTRSPNSAMTYISEIDAEEVDVFEPPLDQLWEILREHVVLQEKIGEGAFGLVMKGIVYGLPNKPSSYTVAVKTIKDDASNEEFNDFVSEIETMKSIGNHRNIINMIGVCSLDGPILLIVEHAEHGNLRDFMRRHRLSHGDAPENNNLYQTTGDPLVMKNLIPMAYQAAKGMEYLASKKCIHRDLAARNVLLAKDYVLKIADFGLSRNLRETDYYRKTTHGRLPVMWLSIEALFDQKYTIMSDVWSFGILLWEIFTLGCAPYPGIPVERLFMLLKTGYRMSSPDCPPNIYTMMLRCWSENPLDRPTMEEIANELGQMLASSTSLEYLDLLSQSSENCCMQDTQDDGRETNV